MTEFTGPQFGSEYSAWVAQQNELRRMRQREEEARLRAQAARASASADQASQARAGQTLNGQVVAAEDSSAARLAKRYTDDSAETRKAIADADKAELVRGREQLEAARTEARDIAKQQPQLRAPDGRLAAASAYFADRPGRAEKIAGWEPDHPRGASEFDIEVD